MSRAVALWLAFAATLSVAGTVAFSRPAATATETAVAPSEQRISFHPSPVAAQLVPRARPDLPRAACGPAGARVVRFRVHVASSLDTSPGLFARQVRSILCDERGWTSSGVRFAYDPEGAYVVSLRPAAATERRCMDLIGLSVRHTWSCAGTREAVLNAERWFDGSPSLALSVQRYRHLLVNHEVGHLLGHRHRSCSAPGERAPVMMQQSKGLGGCVANGWPLAYELA